MYTKKIITAGPLVKECIYPRLRPSDDPQIRSRVRQTSSEAQRIMNNKASWQKLEMLLAANFVRGDIVGCLTFNDAKLPDRRDCCRNKLMWFMRKLREARASRGEETRIVWAIEHKLGDTRWHIHFVLNSTGNDYKEIARLWGQGQVDFEPLRVDKNKNYETLARYLCKEAPDKLGQRSWSYSRNCRKPETETFVVPDDTKIHPPNDATVFENDSRQGAWGCYQYIKYAYNEALK